jgi:uncharacterized protein YodC (DUF2158 family)
MNDSGKEPGAGSPQELTLAATVTLGCGTKVTLKELLEAALAAESISQELDAMRYGRLSRGDVVELRSGGPPMTVSRVRRSKKLVDCFWFDFEGRLRKRAFPRIAIWKLEPQTGEPERLEDVDDVSSREAGDQNAVSNNDVPDEDIPF